MIRTRKRSGFALITALWSIVVVGALAVHFHALARADRQIAANARALTRARWAAWAGLARTTHALDRALAAGALRATGDTLLAPLHFTLDDVEVHAVVRDARARLHLGSATQGELRALLDALEAPRADAERTIEALQDDREEALPVGEVGIIRGVPPALGEKLMPLLGRAGDGRVNVNAAPLPVLRTLPGIDEQAARSIVDRRRIAPLHTVFDMLALLPVAEQERAQRHLAGLAERLAFAPREVEVLVRATPRGGAPSAVLLAIVRLEGGARQELIRVIER